MAPGRPGHVLRGEATGGWCRGAQHWPGRHARHPAVRDATRCALRCPRVMPPTQVAASVGVRPAVSALAGRRVHARTGMF